MFRNTLAARDHSKLKFAIFLYFHPIYFTTHVTKTKYERKKKDYRERGEEALGLIE